MRGSRVVLIGWYWLPAWPPLNCHDGFKCLGSPAKRPCECQGESGSNLIEAFNVGQPTFNLHEIYMGYLKACSIKEISNYSSTEQKNIRYIQIWIRGHVACPLFGENKTKFSEKIGSGSTHPDLNKVQKKKVFKVPWGLKGTLNKDSWRPKALWLVSLEYLLMSVHFNTKILHQGMLKMSIRPKRTKATLLGWINDS